MARNIFNTVAIPKVKRSMFDLSHSRRMSFKMGELTPTACIEVNPNEDFTISVENMLRFMPLVSPVMHDIEAVTHWFYVPNRILWDEWSDFIRGETTGSYPQMNLNASNQFGPNSLAAHMTYGNSTAAAMGVSAMPIAAYIRIWNEYYRDQNLSAEIDPTLVPGNNNTAMRTIAKARPLKVSWKHDYFTAALPFAQKGDEVTLPLSASGIFDVELDTDETNVAIVRDSSTGIPVISGSNIDAGTGGTFEAGGSPADFDPNGTLQVDVAAQATNVNALRTAEAVQRWLERDARGGTRYNEMILAQFGSYIGDGRVQRPEYIGGTKQKMVISEVLSSAQTIDQSSNDVPIGQMAGHGVSLGGGNSFKFKVPEHGWIIGLIHVRPETVYYQGMPKQFTRTDREDFMWPALANLGEQAILNKEVYCETGSAAFLDETFGYIPRYAEFKHINSHVSGELRDTLDFWHLARKFTTSPALNQTFVECEPDTRIFADETGDHIIAHIYNNVYAVRPLPKFEVPSFTPYV